VRAEGMDTDVAEEYFDLLKEVTEWLGIQEYSEKLFSVDKTGLPAISLKKSLFEEEEIAENLSREPVRGMWREGEHDICWLCSSVGVCIPHMVILRA
jgi:hypothetical protein